MTIRSSAAAVFSVAAMVAVPASAQEKDAHAECPMHAAHQAAADADHRHGVDDRHDKATGVSHEASVHHFLLFPDGGRIQLEAKDAADTAARDRIRGHLEHVAAEFGRGRFDLPMLIHGRVPPGVEAMQRLKGAIRYAYAPTPRGGRVDITTTGAEAKDAVHAFLRFQIEDHATGDPTSVTPLR
jgi:hypothetical protein